MLAWAVHDNECTYGGAQRCHGEYEFEWRIPNDEWACVRPSNDKWFRAGNGPAGHRPALRAQECPYKTLGIKGHQAISGFIRPKRFGPYGTGQPATTSHQGELLYDELRWYPTIFDDLQWFCRKIKNKNLTKGWELKFEKRPMILKKLNQIKPDQTMAENWKRNIADGRLFRVCKLRLQAKAPEDWRTPRRWRVHQVPFQFALQKSPGEFQ